MMRNFFDYRELDFVDESLSIGAFFHLFVEVFQDLLPLHFRDPVLLKMVIARGDHD